MSECSAFLQAMAFLKLTNVILENAKLFKNYAKSRHSVFFNIHPSLVNSILHIGGKKTVRATFFSHQTYFLHIEGLIIHKI